jgi:hypothetical protein
MQSLGLTLSALGGDDACDQLTRDRLALATTTSDPLRPSCFPKAAANFTLIADDQRSTCAAGPGLPRRIRLMGESDLRKAFPDTSHLLAVAATLTKKS